MNPVISETLADIVNPIQNTRSAKNRQIHARLNDNEIMSNNVLDEEGEIIHLAKYASVDKVIPYNFGYF